MGLDFDKDMTCGPACTCQCPCTCIIDVKLATGYKFHFFQDEDDSEGPLGIIDFWPERLSNLESIKAQVDSQAIQSAIAFLETSNCSYLPAFQK